VIVLVAVAEVGDEEGGDEDEEDEDDSVLQESVNTLRTAAEVKLNKFIAHLILSLQAFQTAWSGLSDRLSALDSGVEGVQEAIAGLARHGGHRGCSA